MFGEWIALTPNLQLLKSPPEMILEQLGAEDLDAETASHSGMYQTKALMKWLDYHHKQFQKKKWPNTSLSNFR